jgi:hypothetical protein
MESGSVSQEVGLVPVPVTPVPWVGSLLWLIGLAAASFAVSEVVATKYRVGRARYIGVLTLVTAALTVGYVVWAGLDPIQLLTTHWAWGIVAALLVPVILSVPIARRPIEHRRRSRSLGDTLLWESVVYGIAEGVLLSTLPVLITWQMIHGLGWTGVAGTVALWTLPIVASLGVIIVHHLGYWEYRNRELRPISLACGLLSLGYLLTGSPIAPTLGHVLLHGSILRHGEELPPHPRPDESARPERVPGLAAARSR